MKHNEILCLKCTQQFSAPPADLAVCPRCGWSVSASEFDALYHEALRVLTYGHIYRDMYEEQVERSGEVTEMACLAEPPQWLVFATLAALSGVIGGVAYDVVKAVIRRLYTKRPENSAWGQSSLENDSGIQILIQHSSDFIDGMPEVNIKVRKAIEEEERADIVSRASARALAETGLESPEVVRAVLTDALRAATQKIKAGDTPVMTRAKLQQLLSDVWNELPDE